MAMQMDSLSTEKAEKHMKQELKVQKVQNLGTFSKAFQQVGLCPARSGLNCIQDTIFQELFSLFYFTEFSVPPFLCSLFQCTIKVDC